MTVVIDIGLRRSRFRPGRSSDSWSSRGVRLRWLVETTQIGMRWGVSLARSSCQSRPRAGRLGPIGSDKHKARAVDSEAARYPAAVGRRACCCHGTK